MATVDDSIGRGNGEMETCQTKNGQVIPWENLSVWISITIDHRFDQNEKVSPKPNACALPSEENSPS